MSPSLRDFSGKLFTGKGRLGITILDLGLTPIVLFEFDIIAMFSNLLSWTILPIVFIPFRSNNYSGIPHACVSEAWRRSWRKSRGWQGRAVGHAETRWRTHGKLFFYLTPSHSFKIHGGEKLLVNVTGLTEERLFFNSFNSIYGCTIKKVRHETFSKQSA